MKLQGFPKNRVANSQGRYISMGMLLAWLRMNVRGRRQILLCDEDRWRAIIQDMPGSRASAQRAPKVVRRHVLFHLI